MCVILLLWNFNSATVFFLLLSVHKTDEEIQEALARKEAKLQLKAERRRKQEVDVERKREQRQAHR